MKGREKDMKDKINKGKMDADELTNVTNGQIKEWKKRVKKFTVPELTAMIGDRILHDSPLLTIVRDELNLKMVNDFEKKIEIKNMDIVELKDMAEDIMSEKDMMYKISVITEYEKRTDEMMEKYYADLEKQRRNTDFFKDPYMNELYNDINNEILDKNNTLTPKEMLMVLEYILISKKREL